MRLKFVLIFLEVVFLVIAQATGSNESVFVPTKDWQEIKEGQSIPQGLHVRINLSTGRKEAKLLDQNDDSDSSLSMVPGEELKDHKVPQAHDEAVGGMKLDALREALRDIPADEYEEQHEEDARGKFKSYEQIKQELKDANMELKSDSEIMSALFDRFSEKQLKDSMDQRAELNALFEDFQYLAHQIDNALEFIDRGGVEKVIWPSLNRTDDGQTRVQALKLLGAIAQNNPKAKVALIERNAGTNLLAALGRASTTEEISAALYAFGSLVRKFPFAQRRLLTPHGFSLLYGVWTRKVELKVKVKVLQLLADVIEDYVAATDGGDKIDQTTVEQYRSTRLIESFKTSEFCKHAGEFFHQQKTSLIADENLSDETVKGLRSCAKLCHDTWSQCPLFRHTLLVLRNNLDHRLDEDSELVEYRREIQQSIDNFVQTLYGQPRDEL